MGENEPEIYEYGDGLEAVNVLREAIKNLYGGVSALKISMDVLNDRIGELEETISKLAELSEKNVELAEKERENIEKLSVELKENLNTFLKDLDRETHLIIDSFIINFRRELENAIRIQKQIIEDVASFRADVKNSLNVMLDSINALEANMSSLTANFKEIKLLTTDLATRMTVLEENTSAQVKELKLLVTDLSLKIASLEKNFSNKQE